MRTGLDEFQDFFKLADLLADALLLASVDGVIVAANSSLQRLFGRSNGELIGKRLAEFADDADAADTALRSGLRSRSFVPCAMTVVAKSGQRLPCRCDGALYRPRTVEASALVVLRFAQKQVAASQFVVLRERIVQLSRENAARRHAEEALAQAAARFRVTLESIGDAVIATDAGGFITFMNPVAENLTGWSTADACRRHLDEVFVIVNEQTRHTVESPVAKVLREGGVVGLANHTLLVRRDGTELPIDDSGAPIRGESGEVEGVVLVFRDLRDRYALERELLAKTARLEETDRRKDEFLTMLAHELRNPLAPLRNAAEVMKRYELPRGAARMTEIMSRQMKHLVRLVDDLLDVQRLAKGKIDLRMGPVSIAELIECAEEVGRPMCLEKGVELRIRQPVPEVRIRGDLARLVQVVGNLIANAAKFSPPGSIVTLQATVSGPAVEISVSDKGVGIAQENLKNIFEPFFQVQHGLAREHGGLGVGLTIVKSIVGMHGGSVHAESNGTGLGSTFTVKLSTLATSVGDSPAK